MCRLKYNIVLFFEPGSSIWINKHFSLSEYFSGLKTFESTETTAKEPEELEAKPGGADEVKPEAQEEQKGKNKPVWIFFTIFDLSQ